MGPFFYLLFLLSCHSLSISAAPPVAPPKLGEACNNVGGWYITSQVCHSVLDTDPQSQTADLNGIAIIAVNIATRNATLVLTDIKRFLQATSDPIQQKALQTCVQVYTDIIPKLKVAAESIKSNKYSEAGTVLDEALGVPAKCDDVTGNYPTIRALVDRVDVSFSNVVSVARAVVGYLANYYSG
ncbi:putative invertase inhibitor [Carex littledalei]|uniref:Putative invertase inhibitor n=1 Tax=Carex littledalei TaxID=544730 RepID=A0A833VEP4_9POAL|nr:putative invertase inhibitor [Carex littledalei]